MDAAHPLLGQFRTAVNRIQLAYASLVLWSYPDTPGFFQAIHDRLSPALRPFPNVVLMVNDPKAMTIACEELYNTTYRAALNDLFPLVKSYCHSTGQSAKLKAQPWFQFWSLLRNCFAHDMKFNFNSHERTLLPVTWSGVTIDISMNGKPLTLGQCPREKMLELVLEVSGFLERDLA